MWINLSKQQKDMKNTYAHVNSHQKVTSAEEFSNQVNEMTCFLDNEVLSSNIPVIAQWAHKKCHGGRDGNYT